MVGAGYFSFGSVTRWAPICWILQKLGQLLNGDCFAFPE